jgi:serine/threonine-protein kinase
MSPEQVRGLRDVDARGDVYAFGVILYEMLTGAFPFDAETYNELIVKIATEEPTPITTLLPDLDPELVEVIARAMARDRNRRYGSVAELATALEPFAGGVTVRRGRSVSGPPVRVFSQRVPRGPGPRSLAAMPTEPARPSEPTPSSVKVAQVAAVSVPAERVTRPTHEGARRTLWMPVIGVCLAAALVALWWSRTASEAERGTRVRATVAPAPALEAAPSTGAAAPPAPEPAAGPELPTHARPLPADRPSPVAAEDQAAARDTSMAAPPPVATQRRRTRATDSKRPAAATAAPAEPTTADRARPQEKLALPTDWDERLGRSPAAAPATPSSPRHAGTLGVDDL